MALLASTGRHADVRQPDRVRIRARVAGSGGWYRHGRDQPVPVRVEGVVEKGLKREQVFEAVSTENIGRGV
jgi:hypothetical protein